MGKRFHKFVEQLGGGLGEAIPMACQDWANTKAAYRFFSNPRVNEHDILEGHLQSTRKRFAATEGPILILHDSTHLSYKRQKISKRTLLALWTGKALTGILEADIWIYVCQRGLKTWTKQKAVLYQSLHCQQA